MSRASQEKITNQQRQHDVKQTISQNTEDISSILQKANYQRENNKAYFHKLSSSSPLSSQDQPTLFQKINKVIPDDEVEEMPMEDIRPQPKKRRSKVLQPIFEDLAEHLPDSDERSSYNVATSAELAKSVKANYIQVFKSTHKNIKKFTISPDVSKKKKYISPFWLRKILNDICIIRYMRQQRLTLAMAD